MAHVYIVYRDETASLITMPLGTEVGVGPGDVVLDGTQLSPKVAQTHNFPPMSVVAKWLD